MKEMKIKYEEITLVKRELERISIEFSPKNLSDIVVAVSKTTNINKKVVQHILCCGSVIENSTGFQYCLPSTRQCFGDSIETKMTYFDTTLEDTDPEHEREEEIIF